jgi:excinuclease ABC subunit A
MQNETLPPISDTEIERLQVYGARVHNLRNIDVALPRNQFVVITGISGSGKSSLAFDTIYAEGQRRYIESFSSYARQFLGSMERPDVDKITGLSPVISIEQKTTNKNPRSTVGTVTEIYDFIRLLYARIGVAYSYETGKQMVRFTENQIMDYILENYTGKKIVVLAPLVRGRKGHYRELFEKVRKQGYLKVRVDGETLELKDKMQVDRYKIHDIELIIDRLEVSGEIKDRLKPSIDAAIKLGNGLLMIMDHETEKVNQFSKQLMCPESGLAYEDPSPNTFSFNSPYGACTHCRGLGVVHDIDLNSVIPDNSLSLNTGGILALGEWRDNYAFRALRDMSKKYKFNLSTPIKELPENVMNLILYGNEEGVLPELEEIEAYSAVFEGVYNMIRRCYYETSSDNLRKWAEEFMEEVPCPDCNGTRLKKESLYFKVADRNIAEISALDISDLMAWFEGIEEKLDTRSLAIATDLLKEIRSRIGFLLDVGLEYLTLYRPTRSLSGGESQRIRLATQIGSQLVGVTYILDEPSIGLHQRDNTRLIKALRELTEVGNTVLVVEHDKDIMMACDYIVDLGPGAGKLGGEIVGEGVPEEFIKLNTLTAKYLREEKTIAIPAKRRQAFEGQHLVIRGAKGHNLKDVDVSIPLGVFVCVTGVSGSGKSSLVNGTLYPILKHHVYNSRQKPLKYDLVDGLQHIDKVIEIDQSPIGRTPRSNPATYIGVFGDIRNLFALLPEAKIRGYKPGRFSFNVKGGRCEDCQGGGMKVIEMNFLPDVHVLCETCMGKRYNRETLEVRYKGKSISDVLEMPVREAVDFFEPVPAIHRKLKTLMSVGLGYVTLGQAATTLSGGEAQRVKLASELSKKDTGRTFYILDEPTTGLHFEDINMLLKVLQKLVDKGNSILVIEHNLDVVKVADHVIDLGPEGGNRGGQIIATGTPEDVAMVKASYTGQYLRPELKLS